jgi:hypothetical protein
VCGLVAEPLYKDIEFAIPQKAINRIDLFPAPIPVVVSDLGTKRNRVFFLAH